MKNHLRTVKKEESHYQQIFFLLLFISSAGWLAFAFTT